jgi:hypothetical protein
MLRVIFISILFLSLFFTGHQLIGYKGIFGGLNVNLNININYEKISNNSYNVSVQERGIAYNSTLSLKEQIAGEYYYIINYSNNKLFITYYSNNYSNLIIYPFYFPFSLSNGSIPLYAKIMNQTKIGAEIITNASIININGELVINYSDLNLTAIPIYYVSAKYIYKNGILQNVVENYTTSAEVFLGTQLTLSERTSTNYDLILALIVITLLILFIILYIRKSWFLKRNLKR